MRKKRKLFYTYDWWINGSGSDPDALEGDFVILSQPDGQLMAPEFFPLYFVSRTAPNGADENLYLYFNNL